MSWQSYTPYNNFERLNRPMYNNEYSNNAPYNDAFSTMPPSAISPNFYLEDGKKCYRVDCGKLGKNNIGDFVEIAGRVQKMLAGRFMHLKDSHGVTQLVVSDSRWDLLNRVKNLPLKSYIAIKGYVAARPPKARNEKMSTGDIEVQIDEILMVKVNHDDKRETPYSQSKGVSFSTSLDVTSEEYARCGGPSIVAKLKSRQYTCASPLHKVANEEVEITLFGWIQQKMLPKFLHIRDGYGILQCILPENDPIIFGVTSQLDEKSIVEVTGIIVNRPQKRVNTTQLHVNGGFEMQVRFLQILQSDNSVQMDITDPEFTKKKESALSKFTKRTYTCGDIKVENVGETVKLYGWLSAWRPPRFFVIEDAYGDIQCIMPDEFTGQDLTKIALKSVLEVEGVVNARPPSMIQTAAPTGAVEVFVHNVKVLNETKKDIEIEENSIKKHRYLNLRAGNLQNNLRIRSSMLMNIRKFLIDCHGFIEIETPTLYSKSPGLDGELLVPTKKKGDFFYLLQNSQQFNQILVAGGVDKFFQISHCFRCEAAAESEDQLEFSQLDIGWSFAEVNDIMKLVEELLLSSYPTSKMIVPFEKMTYEEAVTTYGSSVPDISYRLTLQDVTEIIKNALEETTDDFGAHMLVIKKEDGYLSKKMADLITKNALENFSDVQFIGCQIHNLDSFQKKDISADITSDVTKLLVSRGLLEKNDSIFISYGSNLKACLCLGASRTIIAEKFGKEEKLNINRKYQERPIWITDLPLFAEGQNGKLQAYHHPFTAPAPNSISELTLTSTDALKIQALSCQLVVNGQIIARGSVLNHMYHLQNQIFKKLDIPFKAISKNLEVLSNGCPPNVGISLDIDRLVTLACAGSSVSDVIAFPQSAPNSVTEEELSSYHIRVDCKEKSTNIDLEEEYPSSKKLKITPPVSSSSPN